MCVSTLEKKSACIGGKIKWYFRYFLEFDLTENVCFSLDLLQYVTTIRFSNPHTTYPFGFLLLFCLCQTKDPDHSLAATIGVVVLVVFP